MTPDDDDLTPDPQTAADDAADDAHTERWREERARGREHEVECPWNADHLAALERVRVETLREAKRAVFNNDGWLDAMKAIDKAIDRLIDATTTGDTA